MSLEEIRFRANLECEDERDYLHAEEDRDHLLAALAGVLAVADVLDGRMRGNQFNATHMHREGRRSDAAAYEALWIAQSQTAQEIRTAVNNALEQP